MIISDIVRDAEILEKARHEAIEFINSFEAPEEPEEAPKEENKEEDSIADQLIRFAGLDAPTEEIEPAEEVEEEDLTTSCPTVPG